MVLLIVRKIQHRHRLAVKSHPVLDVKKEEGKIPVFSLLGMVKLLIIGSFELGRFHGDFMNCSKGKGPVGI